MPLYNIYDENRKLTGRKASRVGIENRSHDEYSLKVAVFIANFEYLLLYEENGKYSTLEERTMESETSIISAKSIVFETFHRDIFPEDFTIISMKTIENDFLDYWLIRKDIDFRTVLEKKHNAVLVSRDEFIKIVSEGNFSLPLSEKDINFIFGKKDATMKEKLIRKNNNL